ncbi:MAG: LacI family DNA-binding transcriptional regulator [Acidimicrobiia bacterium]
MNGTCDVSEAKVERVRAAVAKLGYQPFGPARAMRQQLTNVWAVIVADIENPFFTSVVRGIEDGARERGYRVMLGNSDEDLDRERAYIDVAIAERMGGVMIAMASTRQSDIEPLLDRGIPVVAIDRRPVAHSIDSVLVDNQLGAFEATSHLIERGARRIGCITGPRRISTANERLSGYRRALRDAGIAYDSDLVVRRDFRQQGGYDATQRLCGGSRRSDRPDALFVANNQMSVGAVQALQELGRAMPDDVAVVGFDDSPWATLIRPQLSVVAQPTYDIGFTAAELLATAGQQRERVQRQIVLPPKLVVRESSGA